MGEPADELRRVGAEAGVGHPLGGGVWVVDPLPGADLVLDLLQDHHFAPVVERPVDPDLAHAAALEPLETVVHLDHQRRHVVDRGHHADHDPADVVFGRRAVQVDLLDDLTAEYRRNVVGAGNVEPFENRGRPQYVANRSGVPNSDCHQYPPGLPNRRVENHMMGTD